MDTANFLINFTANAMFVELKKMLRGITVFLAV